VKDPAIGEGADADAEIRSRRSKRSTGKKKKGARSSSARRQRSIEAASEGEEKQDDDLKPDYEAEEVTKKAKFGESPNHVNKEDLFKPVRELER
jgi:DNA-binding transcriptional regulator YdaS (Cro superfamily)